MLDVISLYVSIIILNKSRESPLADKLFMGLEY